MERDELARRYRLAQLHSKAMAAEQQPTEDQQQDAEQTAAPTLAQIMGLQRREDIGPGMTENDRLRQWMGL